MWCGGGLAKEAGDGCGAVGSCVWLVKAGMCGCEVGWGGGLGARGRFTDASLANV